MTTVVNIKQSAYDEYIGRGSLFGNPYELGRDGSRDLVIEKYKKWLGFLCSNEVFRRELLKLRGKRLGCYCKPEKCHGDVIAEYLNNLVAQPGIAPVIKT